MSGGRRSAPASGSSARSISRAARARGRGVFLLSAHFGGWELGAIRAGLIGEPIAPVVRPLDNPLLERELARRRTRFGNRLIAKRDAARDILARAARRTRPSRSWWTRTCFAREAVFVPFFGRLAATTPALALFQLKTDARGRARPSSGPRAAAATASSSSRRSSPRSSVEGLDRDEAVRRATARYMEVTEAAIRREARGVALDAQPVADAAAGGRDRVKRVSSIAPNWIGDAVMSLPVLRALRRAGIRTTASRCSRAAGPAAIYRAEGSADAVLARSSFSADARGRCGGGRFDEAWLLPELVSAPRSWPRASGARTAHRLRGRAAEAALLTGRPAAASGNRCTSCATTTRCSRRRRRAGLEPPRLPSRRGRAGAARERSRRGADCRRAAPSCAVSRKRLRPRRSGGPPRASPPSPTRSPRGASRRRRRRPGRGATSALRSRRRRDPARPSSAPTSIRSELAAALSLARAAVSNDSGPMHLAGGGRHARRRPLRPDRSRTHRPVGLAVPDPRPLRLLLAVLLDGVPVWARVHEGDHGGGRRCGTSS